MAPKKFSKAQKSKIGQDKKTVLRVEPYMHFGKFTPAALRGPGQPGVLAEGRELREEILLRPEGLGHALLGELRALPPAEEGALDEIVHDSGIGRVPDREQEGRSRDDGEADRPLRR